MNILAPPYSSRNTNTSHTHTHIARTQYSYPLWSTRSTPVHHSSSGQSSSPPPISVAIAVPATYTHQDIITTRKTENIPRLRLPRTTVIDLSKLVRRGGGGACCQSLPSMMPKRLRGWFSYDGDNRGREWMRAGRWGNKQIKQEWRLPAMLHATWD